MDKPDLAGLSIAECAKLLTTSPFVIRGMIARGELPAYRVGLRLIRVRAEDLNNSVRPLDQDTFTAASEDSSLKESSSIGNHEASK